VIGHVEYESPSEQSSERRLDDPSGSRSEPVFNDSISKTELSCGFVEWLCDLDEVFLTATIELQEQSRFGRPVIVRHTPIRKALVQIDASRT
jgi:hypothetical protein